MSNTARNVAKPNIYQIVTDRIIHSLETGVIPWEKPWKAPHFHGGLFPRNFSTGEGSSAQVTDSAEINRLLLIFRFGR